MNTEHVPEIGARWALVEFLGGPIRAWVQPTDVFPPRGDLFACLVADDSPTRYLPLVAQ